MSNVKKMKGEDYFTFDLSGGHASGKESCVIVELKGSDDNRWISITPFARHRNVVIVAGLNGFNIKLEG